MVEKTLPPGLHVILGDSAGGIFKLVFHPPPGRLVVDPDVLCCGPTREFASVADWKALRFKYWRDMVGAAMVESISAVDALEDHATQFRDADRITIWAATSLSEQLFIAHVVRLCDRADIDPQRLRLVQFESLEGRGARVLGTGELNEKYLSEHPDPVPFASEALQDYRDAWSALVSPDPLLVERFPQTHPGANAWLKGAMRLLLRRFPDKQSGLPYWDRILLNGVRQHGPKAARVIGYAIANDMGDGDLVGDWYLFGRLKRLGDANLPHPLVEIEAGAEMRATQVRLTPFGLDVLEGRASNYPANPIDDYAAGVRLSSRDGSLWFTDGERLLRGAG